MDHTQAMALIFENTIQPFDQNPFRCCLARFVSQDSSRKIRLGLECAAPESSLRSTQWEAQHIGASQVGAHTGEEEEGRGGQVSDEVAVVARRGGMGEDEERVPCPSCSLPESITPRCARPQGRSKRSAAEASAGAHVWAAHVLTLSLVG